MDHNSMQPLVVDCGSGLMKAGFAGDDAPKVVFPTMIGKPLRGYAGDDAPKAVFPNMIGKPLPASGVSNRNNAFIGDKARSRSGLVLTYPFQRGVIKNWDDFEMILHHTFYDQLRVAPEQHPVLLTEMSRSSNKVKEEMTQIMFEKFDVPGLYISPQAPLSLLACGRTTGVVLECGDGVTQVVPIHDGSVLRANIRFNVAGCEVTDCLMKIANERGYKLSSSVEREVVRDMKEKLGYVALDYEEELEITYRSSSVEKEYELPDGQLMTIGAERFRSPEVLFQPSLAGSRGTVGIHEAIYNSVMRSPIGVRKHLYDSIVVGGGSTMFPGFVDRLTKELTALFPSGVKINVIASPKRKYNVWIGGSILASQTTFKERWISKNEYGEHGTSIIHSKCSD